MTVRQSGQSDGVNIRGVSLQKMRELEEHIGTWKGQTREQLPLPSSFPLNALSAELFKRAPHDFLPSRSVEELREIVFHSARCLAEHLAARKLGAEALNLYSDPERRSLGVALSDRPFIVSSIRECARVFGCEVRVLLHPILSIDGEKISLSYLEVDEISEERFHLFQRMVEGALRDVILSTDDFGPILMKTDRLAGACERSEAPAAGELSQREVGEFLRWLSDGSFIFLGYAERRAVADGTLSEKPDAALGIFKTDGSYAYRLLDETYQDACRAGSKFLVTKLGVESRVHRRLRLVHVCVLESAESGGPAAAHSFVGLLTSKALATELSSIPIVRRKLREVVESEGVHHNSYDYKYIVDTMDRMPKEISLRLDVQTLRELVDTAIGIHGSDYTRVGIYADPSHRGVFVLVITPRERFNEEVRDRIQRHLEEAFGASPGSAEFHLDFSLDPQVKTYFYLPVTGDGELPPVDVAALGEEITRLSHGWKDNLSERVLESSRFADPEEVLFAFRDAFPPGYQALRTAEEAERDIEVVSSLSADNPLEIAVETVYEGSVPHSTVVVYNLYDEISVSRSLPVLENAGLEVRNSSSALVSPRGAAPVYIHRLLVEPRPGIGVTELVFPSAFAPGLKKIFLGQAENDALNALLLTGPLDIRSISVLRAYSCLLWQVNKFATRGAIFDALASVPQAARILWELFDGKFDPARGGDVAARRAAFADGLERYKDVLREVKEITKDRILRSLALLLEHTVRTNFYQDTPVLALKLHSEKIDILPYPRPLYEIFVRSPHFEGIHLRAGKVARGGLRWSERTEDYRAEILGLMKTQKVKNVLIVPGGAKGGFALRHLPKEPKEVPKAVEGAYREFIRALLTLADNRVDGEVAHPKKTVIYDDPDPYFVVAADKGTATFSDLANRIATEEFNFWLGDAFASGGSKGYDHKLYGITAKGGWECVKRHFHDTGLDYLREPFTVIGIGDMSGDVFGNAMILSDQIKLLGAFNHEHIFLDPDPDPAASFKERMRLFATPRTKWSDYDPSLISPGGGVFGRFEKEIRISPEIRRALSIGDEVPDVMNGEELISHVLRAKCDLLWNGGIGTYVKSHAESHADVNDGHNDRVRVNANELRARVVGEGGNLGFTQRARIEFSLAGGLINTDAIDNSGGVDLSDHEVNLKILFSGLLRDGAVTLEERDKVMLEISGDVVESVLDHNRSHAIMLSLAVVRSRKSVAYFQSLLRQMTKLGYVNRSLDFLPDDESLLERAKRKGGLTRPELAICLAAVKMWIKDVLLGSELVKDPLLKGYLLDYFPAAVQDRFKEAILAHPLGANIIATQVTNNLVDAVGITFVHRMCINHSVTPITVIKCALAAEILVGARGVREELEKFDNPSGNQLFLTMRREVSGGLRDACSWLIASHGHDLTLDQIVDRYSGPYETLLANAEGPLAGEDLVRFRARMEEYSSHGLADASARRIALIPAIVQLLELLSVSLGVKQELGTVAAVYASVREELGMNALERLGAALETSNKWEHQLLVGAYEELRKCASRTAAVLLAAGVTSPAEIGAAVRRSPSFDQLMSTVEEMRLTAPTVAALAVVSKQLRAFEVLP